MENWQINCDGLYIDSLQLLTGIDESDKQLKGITINELPKIGFTVLKKTMKQRQIDSLSRKRFKKMQESKVFIRYRKADGRKATKVVLLKDIKFTLQIIHDETT